MNHSITTDKAGYEQLVRDRDAWKERAHELEALEAQTARQRDGYARRAVAAEAECERLRQELKQARECCARPPGTCFNPEALAGPEGV